MNKTINRKFVTSGGGAIWLEESQLQIEPPDESHALVKVSSCCLCESDSQRIFGNSAHTYPLVVGHEFAGQIVSPGPDSQFQQGDKVAVFPLLPCQKCQSCNSKKYNLCASYDYLGSRRDGGLQDYLWVPEWNLCPIPAQISIANASMVETCAVALHALRKIEVDECSRLAILGGGLLARLVIELIKLREMPDEVVVIDRNLENVEHFLEKGISAVLSDFEDRAALSEEHNLSGYTHVLDFVSSSESLEAALGILGPQGTLCLVGNPKRDVTVPRSAYSQILRQETRIVGAWNSQFGTDDSDWDEVVSLMAAGFNPSEYISDKVSLNNLPDFFDSFSTKKGRLPRKLQVIFD